jgi:hypothetical protein
MKTAKMLLFVYVVYSTMPYHLLCGAENTAKYDLSGNSCIIDKVGDVCMNAMFKYPISAREQVTVPPLADGHMLGMEICTVSSSLNFKIAFLTKISIE